MNFLELSNRLLTEAAISGHGLITTEKQRGEYKLAVDYINSAYQDIQLYHQNWNFMRKDFSFNTIKNTRNYSSVSVDLDNLGEWSQESLRISDAKHGGNEIFLSPIEWDYFRNSFEISQNRNSIGMPVYFTVKPDNSISFYPTPDSSYLVSGEYFCEPFVFEKDEDKPVFPSRFHMIIVWRALMFFSAQMNAQELYAIGNTEYRKLMFKLEQFALPHHEISEALA